MTKKTTFGVQVNRFRAVHNLPDRDSAVGTGSNESAGVDKHSTRNLALVDVLEEPDKL
jgi:hypothetical protein